MQFRLLVVFALFALLPVLATARTHHSIPSVGSNQIDSSNIDAALAELQSNTATLLKTQWNQFKTQHNKQYESKEFEAHRFAIFQENMKKAADLQQRNPTAKFGVTQFSDLHPVEFKRYFLKFVPAVGDSAVLRQSAPVRKPLKSMALPTNFDWRAPDGSRPVGVTAVKDQGQCGSCWAFSATEAVESAYMLKGHRSVALAPQQTVDCDNKGSDQGCNGGDTVSAYAYMKTAGVEAEASYPYTSGFSGSAGTCAYNSSAIVAKISGFVYATPGCTDSCDKQNEELLAQNLYQNGPVSICVDASPWQTYISGVLTADSGCNHGYTDLDHCVQLTGFGVDPSTKQKYWSVRNSWAESWGEKGYIRLLYGQNLCGVADEATQVTVSN